MSWAVPQDGEEGAGFGCRGLSAHRAQGLQPQGRAENSAEPRSRSLSLSLSLSLQLHIPSLWCYSCGHVYTCHCIDMVTLTHFPELQKNVLQKDEERSAPKQPAIGKYGLIPLSSSYGTTCCMSFSIYGMMEYNQSSIKYTTQPIAQTHPIYQYTEAALHATSASI